MKSFPLDSLVTYKLPNPKIRLGRNGDGGYVILDGFTYDFFIGCGIDKEVSFENDFCQKYNIPCVAFDGTVNGIPDTKENIRFVQKNISGTESDTTTNLHDLIKDKENIFLKMDIEGGEYDWLPSLSEEQLNKFAQIVIEFHYPFTKEKTDCLEQLNKTHWLCHFHGNNCDTFFITNDVIVPRVFECTYINKKFTKEPPPRNDTSFPTEVDRPNDSSRADITLQGYPFSQ